jgi:hypothetical protein
MAAPQGGFIALDDTREIGSTGDDAGVISSILPLLGGKIKVSSPLKPVKQHLTKGRMPFDDDSGQIPWLGDRYMTPTRANLMLAGPRAR